jgi:hypothetical protein
LVGQEVQVLFACKKYVGTQFVQVVEFEHCPQLDGQAEIQVPFELGVKLDEQLVQVFASLQLRQF